jgi:hypothetical protein
MVNLYGPWERRRLACPRQGFGTAKPLLYHQSQEEKGGLIRTKTRFSIHSPYPLAVWLLIL